MSAQIFSPGALSRNCWRNRRDAGSDAAGRRDGAHDIAELLGAAEHARHVDSKYGGGSTGASMVTACCLAATRPADRPPGGCMKRTLYLRQGVSRVPTVVNLHATASTAGGTVRALADAFLDSPVCRNPNTRRGYTTTLDKLAAELGGDRLLVMVDDEETGQALEPLWGEATVAIWNTRRGALGGRLK